MKHIMKRFDGVPLIFNDRFVARVEPLSEDSDYTILRFHGGDEVMLDEVYDSVYQALNCEDGGTA